MWLNQWEVFGGGLEEKRHFKCLQWLIDVTHTIHNKHATHNSIELLGAFFMGGGVGRRYKNQEKGMCPTFWSRTP